MFVEGLQVKRSLGRFPDLPIPAARKEAGRLRSAIAAGGSEALPSSQTFADLAAAYLSEYARTKKKTWRQDERRIQGRLLPLWGARRLTAITVSDAQKIHNRIGAQAPYEANRVLALVGKMFSLAIRWGWLSAGQNPAAGIEKFPERRRDIWVRPEQMPALVAALAAEDDLLVRAGIVLYLMTGLRKMELLSRRWEDWDAERGILSIPETKAGRPFYVSLSGPARAILGIIPRIPGSPWIFPGPDPERHLADFPRRPTRIWRTIQFGRRSPSTVGGSGNSWERLAREKK